MFALKMLHVQSLYVYATAVFGLVLLSSVWDFRFRRSLDREMTRLTLEGVKLEKQSPRIEHFFHENLRNFGIMRTMLQRALLDVGALSFFSIAVMQWILSIYPTFTVGKEVLYPAIGLFGFLLSNLYYKPLQPLADAKQELLASL